MTFDPHKPDNTALPCRKIQVKIPCPLMNLVDQEDKRRGGKQRNVIFAEALEHYFDFKGEK